MKQVKLGLKENWEQFSILVLINAFVGGMMGLERSILPQIAEKEFHLSAKITILSFILVFGIVKAFTNYYTGTLANRFGRKKLLIAGWLVAFPIPLILMFADHWYWIVWANVLLGIHQGLSWSSTVLMKIDLVGEKNRGLAMGWNEFAGYISVAVITFLTAWIAASYGIRPYPFYLGIALVILGLAGSYFLVQDTRQHLTKEAAESTMPRMKNIFFETTWKNKNLGSVTQAGLVNNLNDGMIWGLLPFILAGKGFSLAQIGLIAAIYPAVWGIGQLFTGKMADIFCKKDLLYLGMALQGLALVVMVFVDSWMGFVLISVALGWGTAMVYPTFLATIAENTHPRDRAESLGIFRLWRDLGYAFGALFTGLLADFFHIAASIFVVGLLTLLSSLVIYLRMKCPPPHKTLNIKWKYKYLFLGRFV